MTPNDRRYTKDHEWLLVEGDRVKIGITDHAQDALGDIVFVELPAVGDSFAAGDSFAVVESVKAASEIYTQAAGEVVAVNDELDAQPELINQDPYNAYLAEIEFSGLNEAALLTADEYEALIAEEA